MLIDEPRWQFKGRTWSHLVSDQSLEELHEFAGNLILILAGLHAAAAIFHHLVLKDGVLMAMLPGRKAR